MREWQGVRVLIIGAARQGIALTRYLAHKGARILLNDQRPAQEMTSALEAIHDLQARGLEVASFFGGHPMSLLDDMDMVCVSGGVPLTLPLVVEAQKRGIPLSNDSQIFMEAAPCPVIGITGSAGKTTTTALVERILMVSVEDFKPACPFQRAWVGGNIGKPLISFVDEIRPDDLAVMELSSFQLEIMTRSPQIATLLNVTPNHLDRHANMQAYIAAKKRILEFQAKQDCAILGRDDPIAWSMKEEVHGQLFSFGFSGLMPGHQGTFLRDGRIYFHTSAGGDVELLSRDDITLRGEHNVLNVLAACAIACVSKAPVPAIRQGVRSFKGVPHRLEYVRTWGGADWYNDSIATAPERVVAAIQSFQEPIILLAGGRDKKLPWDDFASLVQRRVRHLILFGEAADTILRAVQAAHHNKLAIRRCSSLREAVQVAAQLVEPGDVVLLSPGGTSFDEFRDFEERGECFTKWVKELL